MVQTITTEDTLLDILFKLNKLFNSNDQKTKKFKALYKVYIARLRNPKTELKEFQKAIDFFNFGIGPHVTLNPGFEVQKEKLQIATARDKIIQRNFLMQRLYIIGTLPKKMEKLNPFLEVLERIALKYAPMNKFICESIWRDYSSENPIKKMFLGSCKVTNSSLSKDVLNGNFDDYGTKPSVKEIFSNVDEVNYKQDTEKRSKLLSSIFITDDERLSKCILGCEPNFTDDKDLVITEMIKENVPNPNSLYSGYGTILIFNFPKKNFRSILF